MGVLEDKGPPLSLSQFGGGGLLEAKKNILPSLFEVESRILKLKGAFPALHEVRGLFHW